MREVVKSARLGYINITLIKQRFLNYTFWALFRIFDIVILVQLA